MPAVIARLVVVHGRVQGVGFRYSTVEAALRFEVVGWVRNRADGTVEAWIQGAGDAVHRLLAWIEVGPRTASVTSVEVQPVTADQMLEGFDLRW